MKRTIFSQARVAGAALLLSAHSLSAQTDAQYQKLEQDLQALRQQLGAMQERHARELEELRALLERQRAAPAQAQEGGAASLAPVTLYDAMKRSVVESLPDVAGAGAGSRSFDLDLSAVLDLYFYHDDTREGAGHLRQHLAGFGHGHDDGEEGHDHGPRNGFNLRHVELGFSAAVDPYFRAWTTVAVDEEGAELEEAVLQTTSLPYGLTLSGGKMMSGIGRLNRQHSHNWDFVDQPLIYELLFGSHGLAETGVQLTWLAPTPFYLLVGAELFNGENEHSFAAAEAEGLPAHDAPRLWTGFVKAGPDLGESHALQFGASALGGRHQVAHADDEGADGDTLILGADFVYKYDDRRAHGQGDFVLQGEYFYRDMDLDGVADWAGAPWTSRQDGYYVQALYGFLPRWRGGLRWEQVGLTNELRTPEDGAASFGDSCRAAAMLDWRFSEFSLLRAQAGRGRYETYEGREEAWEFALQWQVTFGKHAAHDF